MATLKKYNPSTQNWEPVLGGGSGGLPTATTAGDVPAWDMDNSEWTTLAKGSIASENTGYVTGGDVYTVVGNVESALSSINTALAGLIGGDS